MIISTYKNILLRTGKAHEPSGDIWFIHGFGESGLSFIEAFNSPLIDAFDLFIPDLPGFGVSPLEGPALDQRQTANHLYDVITDLSGKRPIFLVGHSQGGLIATWLCKKLGSQVKAYVSIEGNLTKADVTFSAQAASRDVPAECKTHILDFIRENSNNEESFWRYYASLRFASPDSLFVWAKASMAITGKEKAGNEYVALSVPKLYLWGRKSCPQQTKDFMASHDLNDHGFENSGHWPMIDEPGKCYGLINDFFKKRLK